MKNIVDCIDVKLSKRKVIKLCEEHGLSWLEYTNVNGGKYIECIVGYDWKAHRSLFIDIYYKCLSNLLLYQIGKKKQTKQFYIDQIITSFDKHKNTRIKPEEEVE